MQVAAQAAALPMATCHQLLREAALREEWRCAREQQLLLKVASTGLTCLQGQDGSQLTEQLVALQQASSGLLLAAMCAHRVPSHRHRRSQNAHSVRQCGGIHG